jgi:sugar lactone lactonase YvrE
MMRTIRRASLTISFLTAVLAGCSALVPAGTPAPGVPAVQEKGYLYLGNSRGSQSTLTVYPLQASKPLRVVPRTWGVNAMAIDPFGNVYTSNGLPSGGEITVYAPGGGSILVNIDTGAVTAFAFDAQGDVYVSDNGFITEYAPHSSTRIRFIGPETFNVDALAVDGSGNLYAAQLGNNSSGIGRGSVKVFAPTKTRAFRKIRHGINTPVALAFDASGNLYVANCPSCYAKNGTGSVAEYAPGGDMPIRVLTSGIDNPDALVVGNDGALFVANDLSLSSGVTKPGWVSVYSSTGKSPLHRITHGTKAVNSLAIDAEGYVYAESGGKRGDIVVLAPDGSQVVRTITDGVDVPNRIAVGY